MDARVRRCCQLLLLVVAGAQAAPAVGEEAWLVTYGPGQEVWERFGHNALWLRDAELGLDHVYSFGYFDMDQPGFHLDFARGIMRYYGSASPPESEFAFYRMRDRTIRTQRLDLDSEQFRELHRLLHEAIFPVPQYYDYDYFFANCSTWLRDLLDEVLDGALRERLGDEPARLIFRDHIRRYNQSRLELHAGLMLLLGPAIDRPRTAWEEGFVPAGLADWIGQVEIEGRSLVRESETLYSSRNHQAPQLPSSQWWAYGLVSLLFSLLVLLPLRFRPAGWPLLPWRISVLGAGAAGIVVLVMDWATGHEVIDGNRVVLLLNPFWLVMLLPLPRVGHALLWWLLAAGAGAGAVLLAWPGSPQYRPEVVCGLLPLLSAMLWVARLRIAYIRTLRSNGGSASG